MKPGFKATDNAGNLDYLIDMRASNLDPKVGWHGYHAVERDLFQGGAITASTKTLAAELTTNVEQLQKLVPTLSYKPEDLANGAASLLEEVQTEKVTGEEEAFSHIDLVDLAANVEGAEEAFAYLRPGLQKLDPSITKTIAAQFTATDNLMNNYRDKSALGGYISYDAGHQDGRREHDLAAGPGSAGSAVAAGREGRHGVTDERHPGDADSAEPASRGVSRRALFGGGLVAGGSGVGALAGIGGSLAAQAASAPPADESIDLSNSHPFYATRRASRRPASRPRRSATASS